MVLLQKRLIQMLLEQMLVGKMALCPLYIHQLDSLWFYVLEFS